jgi:hypothetical protein
VTGHGPSSRRDPGQLLQQTPECVIFIGETLPLDVEGVSTSLAGGAVVVLAPSLDALGRWFPGALRSQSSSLGIASARSGDLEIDLTTHEIRWSGKPVDLSIREFEMLALFGDLPGRVWTFEELMKRIWGSEYVDRMAIHSALKRLRRKLSAAGVGVAIESVRGMGFRLTRSKVSDRA